MVYTFLTSQCRDFVLPRQNTEETMSSLARRCFLSAVNPSWICLKVAFTSSTWFLFFIFLEVLSLFSVQSVTSKTEKRAPKIVLQLKTQTKQKIVKRQDRKGRSLESELKLRARRPENVPWVLISGRKTCKTYRTPSDNGHVV